MTLTDIQCRSATSAGKKILKLADTAGLYLWVYEDGKKYWRLRYYKDNKEKSISLGVYPVVSLKEARARRDVLRKELEAGTDPLINRKLSKIRGKVERANTFEVVAREWLKHQENAWGQEHTDRTTRRLEQNIFPAIGNLPIAEIDAAILLTTLREIEKRGATDLSHRVLQVCGKIFRYGIATSRCSADVTYKLSEALKPHQTEHQTAIHPDDLPALMAAINTYQKVGDYQTMLALRLLMYTFVRTSELIESVWFEIDMDKKLWTIPAERMKKNKLEFLVPLSRQSMAVLVELRQLNKGQFVFPGRSNEKPMSNNTMLFALYRLGYKGKMSGHGARSVASTVLNEQGKYRHDVIERQLAHVERNKVRGAYNRAEYIAERVNMMQEWADYLDSLN